ncbi:Reverse transcriptase (RNA-dependent DNA polymerase) [Popillia japonica]|uniref:Reverse transcriptase (RNA-dependent DNA polymerase) n=1 Tax=Popillia japonica TaxID=7064 RepID=A0AAW1ITW8_POPJA
MECINKELDGGAHVAGPFFDLSRAFDTVSICFMVDKLFQMGVRGNLLNWLQSFMSHRKLNINISGNRSADYDVNLGAAQGSVLGPILFLIFVNDMSLYVKPDLLMNFADDTAVVRSAEIPDQLQTKIERVTAQMAR